MPSKMQYILTGPALQPKILILLFTPVLPLLYLLAGIYTKQVPAQTQPMQLVRAPAAQEKLIVLELLRIMTEL